MNSARLKKQRRMRHQVEVAAEIQHLETCLTNMGAGGDGCDYIVEISKMLSELTKEKYAALADAAEAIYAQRKQFSFWAVEPVVPLALTSNDILATTTTELLSLKSTFAEQQIEKETEDQMSKEESWFAYSFDENDVEHAGAFKQLQKIGSACFAVNPPGPFDDPSTPDYYEFRYSRVRGYTLPALPHDYRKMHIRKEAISEFLRKDRRRKIFAKAGCVAVLRSPVFIPEDT